MKNEKCGVYQIQCRVSQKLYVGSSVQIYTRWAQHRQQLRKGTHASPRLMRAWTKHGEENFVFSIIEECPADQRFVREQHHIDTLTPVYNSMPQVAVITAEMRGKINATLRMKADLITHCPKGHTYDEGNTYLSPKNQRVCRACSANRVSLVYAAETPEQREVRLARMAEYAKTDTAKRAMAEYAAAHRSEKQAYDKANRASATARQAAARAMETPERRAERLELKRQSYLRHRDTNLVKMREYHASRGSSP